MIVFNGMELIGAVILICGVTTLAAALGVALIDDHFKKKRNKRKEPKL